MAKDHRKRSLPFFALGVAGSRTFLLVGVALWLIGLMMLRPRR